MQSFSSSRSVVAGGSRRLPSSASWLAFSLGQRLALQGFPLRVGCASGADAAFLRGFMSIRFAAAWAQVFAVGGEEGGFAGGGGCPVWVSSALASGAQVHWWAGGGPGVPLRARLAGRARAAVCAAAVGGVFVLSSPESRGSLAAAAAAAERGLAVFVFCFGFPSEALGPLSGAGFWQPSEFLGSHCLLWTKTGQQKLNL